MKLSVSTLGCPGLSLSEILDLTDRAGISGIEVRGIGGIVDSAKIPCFSPEEAAFVGDSDVDMITAHNAAATTHP